MHRGYSFFVEVARRTTLPDDIRRATPDHGLPPEWPNLDKGTSWRKSHRARRGTLNVASIAAKRRNKSNLWFKRRTLFRGAVDVLRRAGTPMTAREIADVLVADKALRPPGSRLSTYRLLSLLRCGGGTEQRWLARERRPADRIDPA
jgi:hypothetical protein